MSEDGEVMLATLTRVGMPPDVLDSLKIITGNVWRHMGRAHDLDSQANALESGQNSGAVDLCDQGGLVDLTVGVTATEMTHRARSK